MFAIDDEKLPPPKPAVAEQPSSTRNCVSWSRPASQPLGTTTASSRHGNRGAGSRPAGQPLGTEAGGSRHGMGRRGRVIVGQRPPAKRGPAEVVGEPSVEPKGFGSAVSQNCSGTDRVIPALPRFST